MSILDYVQEEAAADPDEMETMRGISSRQLRSSEKLKMLAGLKREALRDLLTELPKQGESLHIVSNGSFDYWTFVPVILGLMGGADTFYGSTWTMARPNVDEMFKLMDSGAIKASNIITGLYFKRRESAVYGTLVEGMTARGQKYKALANHAKIILLRKGDTFITVEGSANFTANPRIEQNVVTNSQALYNFHREWIDEVLS